MDALSTLFKVSNAFAKSRQNKLQNRKNKYVWFNLFLQRKNVIKIKFLVGNSAITEVNELKNIYITSFRFSDFPNINLKFFTLRLPKFKWQSFQNESMGKIFLAWITKTNHPK